ncbi:MAG: hypothetical protein KAI66_10715, partial [Lentisphaeria bacterium]|nr:hypothetical protein [Lentisphaeria bacterium]
MMTRCGWVIAWFLVASVWGAPGDMVLKEDFSEGMEAWEYAPGNAEMVCVSDAGPGHETVLDLHPPGAILGVNSRELVVGVDIALDKAYEFEARIKSEGLTAGVFAFSVCCRDAKGKRIQQISIHNLREKSKPHPWVLKSSVLGAGTTRPFPPETRTIVLRFSFWDRKKLCAGRVLVDDVTVKEIAVKKTLTSSWPRSILADVGDLKIRFESRSFWTLYRFDYKGLRLCVDKFGSHYGNVGNFPGIGFVGSGHTENEDERVDSIELLADGVPQATPKPQYACGKISLRKTSRLRSLRLRTLVQVTPGGLLEDAVMTADKPTKLNLIYFFMHPWVTDMSHYLAELPDGSRVDGEFTDSKGMKISKPVKWSAVYSETLQAGAVTAVLAVPEGIKWDTRYWDQPNRYRKHYFAVFKGETVAMGKEYHFRVFTVPFTSSAEA